MLNRRKSRDSYGGGGSAMMSNTQMKDYLEDLRNNKPSRPQGSRPPPTRLVRRSSNFDYKAESRPTSSDHHDVPSRSASAMSYHRPSYSLSGRASPDKLTYAERDHRRQEREEARLVRMAMSSRGPAEDDDEVEENARNEADELIRRHQHPTAPYHVSRGSRASINALHRYSVDRSGDVGDILDQYSGQRGSMDSPRASLDARSIAEQDAIFDPQEQSQSLEELEQDMSLIEPYVDEAEQPPAEPVRGVRRISQRLSMSRLSSRRRSSGALRNFNASTTKRTFPNDQERIYEDPPSPAKPSDEPSWVRRNPFARARQSLTRRTSQSMVQYTAQQQPATNEKVPTQPGEENVRYKNGMEVRSDDIRAATSMKRSDRSTRLPSPTIVSDNPGRPIVSFQNDWRPSEKEADQTSAQNAPRHSRADSDANASMVQRSAHREAARRQRQPMGPPERPAAKIHVGQTSGWRNAAPSQPAVPSISVNEAPAIPSINVSADTDRTQRPIPTITAPDIPSINVADDSTPTPSTRAVPTINMPGNVPAQSSTRANGHRHSQSRSSGHALSHSHRSSGSLSGSRSDWASSARRQTILCAQCALPIVGKIVSAAGTRFHPQCFTCYHCREALECVAFLPEPAEHRAARLERIDRRNDGEHVDPPPGMTLDQDNDDSLRFYCHLDYHEFFSPRCKSCKTPIEGEVIVACGAHWHVGHFFCAQCGDPFDPSIPFVERDGYAWCVNCHTNRTSSKCKKCRKPVTDTVVNALGADWHDHCFTCTECSGPFTEGRYFLRGNSNDPVCLACEERRLKA